MQATKITEQCLNPAFWPNADRYNKRDIDMIRAAAEQYGLNPMTGDIMSLRGNLYVTSSGLNSLAQMHPDYDGCTVDPIVLDWEKNTYVIKAQVWKKGCSRPFEDYGDADPTTSKMKGRALFRHAITRAKARAIRSAFAVPFVAIEELSDEDRKELRQREKNKQPAPNNTHRRKRPLDDTGHHGNLPADDHPAMQSRDNHPTTVEVPAANQGEAPEVPPPGGQHKQPPVEKTLNPDKARKKWHAVCGELNISDESQRIILGVESRKNATPEQLNNMADFLQSAEGYKAYNSLKVAVAKEELRDRFERLPKFAQKMLVHWKDHKKKSFEVPA